MCYNAQMTNAHDLNEKQALFVHSMALTGDAAAAVVSAGYDTKTPASVGAKLLRTPHVIAALQQELRRQLVAAAPMALSVIVAILRNEALNPKVRLDAAKTLLDRAGHIAPRAEAPETGLPQNLHEMSLTELRELASKLRGERFGQAKTVVEVTATAPQQLVELAA